MTKQRKLKGGRNSFQEECCDLFADMAHALGLPQSFGLIYGLLYSDARTLCFGEIVGRLGISKGSASQGIRALREFGAIKLVSRESDRREYFAPETELRKLIGGFLQGTIQPHLQSGGDRLLKLETTHSVDLSPLGIEGDVLLERFHKLQSWYRKGESTLPLIAKILG